MNDCNQWDAPGPRVIPDRDPNDGDPYDDMDEGARRRDVGHASALSHYVVEAVQFEIVTVIRQSPTLTATSDDVLESLSQTTRDSLAAYPNALGACFRSLALAGKIVDTGRMVRSRRPEARKRKIAVWRAP